MNNASLLIGKTIDSLDGEIGSVHDVYFDDQAWSLRYLVIDTGKWLPGRKVLVAPEAIVKPWHHQAAVNVKLATDQIRALPDIDTALPVSRESEELLHRHYQWKPYWNSTVDPIPSMQQSTVPSGAVALAAASLASANDLAGFHVKASDGEVGEVEDLLLDDDLSRILFMVVEVKGLLFGKMVLAGPSLISSVDWENFTVHVDANRQALKNAQEYKPEV